MKTLLKLLHMSMLLLVLPARCGWGVEIPTGAPARVGDLGAPARLSIEGAQTFPQDLGPIGCFVVLHALLQSNQDSWTTFRDLGLKRLTTDDFHRDYLMLLDPRSVITRCLGNLTRELRTLTKLEIEAIAGLLPPDNAALVRQMAPAAARKKELPVTDAIGPALDRWWETTASGIVEADFRSHAKPSAQATLLHPLHADTDRVYYPAGLVAVVNDRTILDSEVREKVSRSEEILRRQHTNNPALFKQNAGNPEPVPKGRLPAGDRQVGPEHQRADRSRQRNV